jgi:subtilisin family serine protease
MTAVTRLVRRNWWRPLSLLFLLPTLLVAGSVMWHPDRSRMDARVENQPLHQVLESLAVSSGWRIYIEPDIGHSVSTRFENLTAPAALQHLLGDLSYALIPDARGSARLYVFQTTVAGATQLIATPPPSSRIAHELVITLDANSRESIDELARRLGAKVTGRLDALRTYRLEFEDEAAAIRARAELERDDQVQSIDSNHRIQPPPDLDPLSPSQIRPLTLTPRVTTDTEQVVVALLDTSIFAEHPSLKDFLLPTVSLAGTPDADASQLTHATMVAETMLRALDTLPHDETGTPVRILPIDIYGEAGTTTTFGVALGLWAALEAAPTLINLSLGTDTDSPFLRRLIQDIASQGITIVAAAGNEPVATPIYPAAYPEVLAVTASDQRGQLASYANFGSFVDVIAPGTAFIEFDNRQYIGRGTSYATAHITGIAAGLASTPHATPAQVEAFLRERFGLVAAQP